MLLLILDRPLLFDNPRARLHFDLPGATTVRRGREIVADILTSLRAGCPRNRRLILGKSTSYRLFYKTSRPSLTPTLPPVLWVKVKVKVKVKFILEQAAKTQRGSRGIALLFP